MESDSEGQTVSPQPDESEDKDNPGQDDGRQRRVAALRSLTSDQRESLVSPPSPPPVFAVSPRRSRRSVALWLSIGALVVALLASGVFIWSRATPPRPAPADPLVLRFPKGGISCPVEAAWSPDGKSIAVLGYSTCSARQPETNSPAITPATTVPTGGVLTIYNATSGAVVRAIWLDSWIPPQSLPSNGQNSAPKTKQVAYNYFDLLWAPDGQGAAVLFDVASVNQQGAAQDYGGGLLLIHVARGAVDVYARPGFLRAYQAARESVFTSPTAPSTLRWDVTTGAMDTVRVPPALDYEWNQNGALRPTQPLGKTPDTPPPAAIIQPIGNPLGGARFSIWQSGILTYASVRCSSSGGPAANDYYYAFGMAHTSAWSPDGRYLYLSVGTLGRLAAYADPADDTLNGDVCMQLGPAEKWLQLPVRDAGMANAITQLDPTTNNQALLTWSPDGKRLAVELTAQAPATANTALVTLYDSQTGKVLTRLTARQLGMASAPAGAPALSSPMWAPDGSALLFLKTDQAKGDYSILVFGRRSLAPAR